MKKRIWIVVLVFLILGGFIAPAIATALPDEAQDHVVDGAGVLSFGVRSDINNLGILMWDELQAEILVVSVSYIDEGLDSEEMARMLFDRWQVSPRGMLLLFSMEEGRCALLIGEEITSSWSANRIEAYLTNYFYDDLDAGRFDAAVMNLVRALALWYEDYYQVDLISGGDMPPANEMPGSAENSLSALFGSILPILVGILIVVLVLGALSGRRGGGGGSMMGRRRGGFFPWFFMGTLFGRRNRWGAQRPPGGVTRPPTGGSSTGSFGSGTFRAPGTGSRGTSGGSRGGFSGGSRGGYGGGSRGGGRGGGFGGRR